VPWIDADEWLAQYERMYGPLPAWSNRPLNYTDAAALADVTGPYHYEHQSDGTTRILVESAHLRGAWQ